MQHHDKSESYWAASATANTAIAKTLVVDNLTVRSTISRTIQNIDPILPADPFVTNEYFLIEYQTVDQSNQVFNQSLNPPLFYNFQALASGGQILSLPNVILGLKFRVFYKSPNGGPGDISILMCQEDGTPLPASSTISPNVSVGTTNNAAGEYILATPWEANATFKILASQTGPPSAYGQFKIVISALVRVDL